MLHSLAITVLFFSHSRFPFFFTILSRDLPMSNVVLFLFSFLADEEEEEVAEVDPGAKEGSGSITLPLASKSTMPVNPPVTVFITVTPPAVDFPLSLYLPLLGVMTGGSPGATETAGADEDKVPKVNFGGINMKP